MSSDLHIEKKITRFKSDKVKKYIIVAAAVNVITFFFYMIICKTFEVKKKVKWSSFYCVNILTSFHIHIE